MEVSLKGIQYNEEGNMKREFNFIEMVKDSMENKTIYKRVSDSGAVYSREYQVIDGELMFRNINAGEFKSFESIEYNLVNGKFIKKEKFKQITFEDAVKKIRECKEIWYQGRYCMKPSIFERDTISSLKTFMDEHTTFYIKE